MSTAYYLLPRSQVERDPACARDWLSQEMRMSVLRQIDETSEIRKRQLADRLLAVQQDFREFQLGYAEIARYEGISIDAARHKYRYIELNCPGIQVTIFERYVAISVYHTCTTQKLAQILAVLNADGNFFLFDPQTETVN